MAIGMSFGKQRCKLGVFDQSEWLVVALALFILDNVALIIELFLGHRAEQMAHAVRFKNPRKLERAGRHGFAIIGAIAPCAAVEIGRAYIFKRPETLPIGVLGTLAHQLLEQMGTTGLTF